MEQAKLVSASMRKFIEIMTSCSTYILRDFLWSKGEYRKAGNDGVIYLVLLDALDNKLTYYKTLKFKDLSE